MPVLDMFRLDDKVVIVTGASSGLGVSFAQACANAGADVVLAARREDRLSATASLVRSAGRRTLTVATDVSDPAQCQALIDAAIHEFGHVDVLVNNAGVGTAVPATRETPDEFKSVVDINLNGCYWAAQACARVMEPGSSIVNISSVLGLTTAGLPQAAYSASKAAVMGLTRDLAQQWGPRKGIRVNAIAPGFFHSRLADPALPLAEPSIKARNPIPRVGNEGELKGVAVFLASDAANYITGQIIVVDGADSIAGTGGGVGTTAGAAATGADTLRGGATGGGSEGTPSSGWATRVEIPNSPTARSSSTANLTRGGVSMAYPSRRACSVRYSWSSPMSEPS